MHSHIVTVKQGTEEIVTEEPKVYKTEIQAKAEILYKKSLDPTWEEESGEEYAVIECSKKCKGR